MTVIAYKHVKRNYLHFDPPPSEETARTLATDPARVAAHSFYPFLGFTIETPRVSKDQTGQLIKKSKNRPIKLAAHLDAAIYGHYGRILSEKYEADLAARGLSSCVTAFRRLPGGGKNNIWFANEVFAFIQDHRPCIAYGFDIEKFFDRLNHQVLKRRWCETLGEERLSPDHFRVFKSLSQFSWVERDEACKALGLNPKKPLPKQVSNRRICSPAQFRDQIRSTGLVWANPEKISQRGIPQGAPISALLSNLYLLAFDTAIESRISAVGGLYRRYCDDIMIVVPSGCGLDVVGLVTEQIAAAHLTINAGKTVTASFPADASLPAEEGKAIPYLGFNFTGVKKWIRGSSLNRYYGKMRRGVAVARAVWGRQNRLAIAHGEEPVRFKKRQLFIRYSYLIKRRFTRKKNGRERQNENFITYAIRASDGMSAPEMKHQIRNHMKKLRAEMAKPPKKCSATPRHN